MPDQKVVKVTFNMPAEELETLKRLAAERHMTMTDTLRKALATERYLRDNTRDGTKVLLRRPDDSYREVVFP